MEADELVASLEYWQSCGINFLSGDKLEYPGRPISQPRSFTPNAPPFTPVADSAPQPYAPPIGAAAPKREPLTVVKEVAPPLAPKPVLESSGDDPMPTAIENSKRAGVLKTLAEKTASCKRCELHLTRKQAVFGVGSGDAPVLFIGEGPGADEDEQGVPFVGAAGQLLDKMLGSVGYSREEVYIANVVKCRPPGNRNPLAEEMALCQKFLIEQIEIIQPQAIFCLGKFALLSLLGYTGPVGKARAQSFSWRGIPVIASFHPAYYLRTPSKKNAGWQDLLRLKKILAELE
jgi:uracil-DNA glycosylase